MGFKRMRAPELLTRKTWPEGAINLSRNFGRIHAVGILLIALLVVNCGCTAGHSSPTMGPSPQTYAGPCLIALTKESDGTVRFYVENVKGPHLVVQRYGDLWGMLRFDVSDSSGKWIPLPPVDTRAGEDFPDPSDPNWVALDPGDALSWILDYNLTGRLNDGQRVRLHWETTGPVPPCSPIGTPDFQPPHWMLL